MALVNYSSTSESSDDEECNNKKDDLSISSKELIVNKSCKFKLPNYIKNLNFAKSVREDDNIKVDNCLENHEGRVRTFDHERGNWATYVYINEHTNLNTVSLDVIQELQEHLKSMFELKSSHDFHISLTKTVILRHHWIDSFVEAIQQIFCKEERFRIQFRSFNIYTNEEKTRTFIGLTVDPIFSNKLKTFTDKLDAVLEEYNLQKFYPEPLFHASILWCLGDKKNLLMELLPDFQGILNELYIKEPKEFGLNVETINIKIGNKNFRHALKS